MNGPTDPIGEEITRLEVLIQGHLSGRIRCLQICIKDDGLVLRGQTRTYYAKQLVQHAVMKVSPLPIRANEIEVS